MCGIAGLYSFEKSADRMALRSIGQRMADSIRHRGPDGEGIWIDKDVPLLLAQRRLSIIDLSADGAQPMASASGRYEIVFNGEIYNFQDLRRDLEAEGAAFRGRSDTEVMLAAFEIWGINRALQQLNGMFAFVLWDREKRQLHMVRDRLGKKPLYYGWAGKNFLFGSELKVFRAHPDFKPVVSRNTLALYMRFGFVPAPHSIYENVWQLEPGHRMTLVFDLINPGDDLAHECIPYWNITRVVEEAHHSPLQGDTAALTGQFENILKRAVRERMISDVPLGAFLSGGVDSSTIVALMQAQSSQRVKTYCIGFNEAGYNEANDARAVAMHLGTDHHEMMITAQDAMNVIPLLPQIYDEPFADASQIPTYLVSKFARSDVTVALSGDGGDELMGGYVRHQAIPALWKRVGWWPQPVRDLARRSIRGLSIAQWNKLATAYPQFGERLYKVADMLPLNVLEDIYIHVTSHWSQPTSIVRDSREPLVSLLNPATMPRGLNFAERMMVGDTMNYLPHDILVKVDRASMAVGLEARAPLLDYKVFEFCWRLPFDQRIHHGQGKYLLRQVLARHVPEDLFNRPKQGFSVPIGDWLRGPLQDWAHELLRPMRLEQEGYINTVQITSAWQEHLAGRGNHAARLWTVLMWQSWLDKWR